MAKLASFVICIIYLVLSKNIKALWGEYFLPKHTNNTDFEPVAAMLLRRPVGIRYLLLLPWIFLEATNGCITATKRCGVCVTIFTTSKKFFKKVTSKICTVNVRVFYTLQHLKYFKMKVYSRSWVQLCRTHFGNKTNVSKFD